jgi:hypothetical protein
VTGCLSTALGDIDGLHRSAASLSEAAGALDQQRAALSGVLSGATTGAGAWTGEAARAFTSDALDTAGDLRHLAEACRTAGDILTRLARALGDILTEAQGLRLRALTAGIELTPGYHVAPTGPGDTFDFYKGILAEELRERFADLHERAAGVRRAAAVELHGVLPPGWVPNADFAARAEKAAAFAGSGVAVYDARKQRARQARVQAAELRATWQAEKGTFGSGGLRRQAEWAERRAARLTKAQQAAAGVAMGPARGGLRIVNGSVDELAGLAGRGGRIPLARYAPVLGAGTAVAGTFGDRRNGVPTGRAVAANAAPLVIGGVLTAAAGVVTAPAWVVAGSLAVLSYGIGSAVHGWIAYGDPTYDFDQDLATLRAGAGAAS